MRQLQKMAVKLGNCCKHLPDPLCCGIEEKVTEEWNGAFQHNGLNFLLSDILTSSLWQHYCRPAWSRDVIIPGLPCRMVSFEYAYLCVTHSWNKYEFPIQNAHHHWRLAATTEQPNTIYKKTWQSHLVKSIVQCCLKKQSYACNMVTFSQESTS